MKKDFFVHLKSACGPSGSVVQMLKSKAVSRLVEIVEVLGRLMFSTVCGYPKGGAFTTKLDLKN
jgi:hypothetical protein